MSLSNVQRLARGLEACTLARPKGKVDELHTAFAAFFQEQTEGLRLKVTPKGLAHSDFMLLTLSPESGVGLQRLHADGVRILGFRRAPSRAELIRFTQVLSAGPSALDALDDMVTALVDARMAFLEVAVEDGGRGREIDEPAMLASIPPLAHDPEPIPDADVAAGIRKGFARAIVRPTASLPKAVLTLLGSCREEEVEPLARWVVEAVLADLRLYRKLDADAPLVHLLSTLAAAEMNDRVLTVVQQLSNKKLAEMALRWLPGSEVEQAMALDAIRVLPERELPALLADLCELPRGKARTRGVAALMGRGERLLAVASQRMSELDGRTTVLLLSSVNRLPLDSHSLTLYRAASTHEDARVRARSLSWLAYFGEKYAQPQIKAALESSAVEDRHAALHLLRIARPDLAGDTLRAFIRSPHFEKLVLSEQKVVALSLVLVDPAFAKGTALSWLEAKKGVSDVTRSTALTVLAAVGDEESVDALAKRSRGFLGSTLKTAAKAALEESKKGIEAFDPEPEIVALLRRTGLIEHVLGSAPQELVAEEVEEVEEEEAVAEGAMSEDETREWLMTNMFDDLALPPLWTEPDD